MDFNIRGRREKQKLLLKNKKPLRTLRPLVFPLRF